MSVSRTEDGSGTTAQLRLNCCRRLKAGAAAQTIKLSIANTAERTGANTGQNSINPSRYTSRNKNFWMIIRSWSFEALGNGYFEIDDISLSGIAALCVTEGLFFNF
jgi:hypothetical protein